MINHKSAVVGVQDPLIGEFANIVRSEYVSRSHLQEWVITARFENAEFPIKVFGEVAVKLAQCGLVLEVGKSQDFSKAPWLFVIGYDAKHNRRAIEAIDTAQGMKKLADLPRRATVESVAPATVTEVATVTAPQIAIVPTLVPDTKEAKLALMKTLANELFEGYAEGSREKQFAAMLLMDLAAITGERMTPVKTVKKLAKVG